MLFNRANNVILIDFILYLNLFSGKMLSSLWQFQYYLLTCINLIWFLWFWFYSSINWLITSENIRSFRRCVRIFAAFIWNKFQQMSLWYEIHMKLLFPYQMVHGCFAENDRHWPNHHTTLIFRLFISIQRPLDGIEWFNVYIWVYIYF